MAGWCGGVGHNTLQALNICNSANDKLMAITNKTPYEQE